LDDETETEMRELIATLRSAESQGNIGALDRDLADDFIEVAVGKDKETSAANYQGRTMPKIEFRTMMVFVRQGDDWRLAAKQLGSEQQEPAPAKHWRRSLSG
jgi:hypothetical protein